MPPDPNRRGYTLLHAITAIFAGALALGLVVPLFIAARRHADVEMLRARMTAEAREIAFHFREDARRATAVDVGPGGTSVSLALSSVDSPSRKIKVRYRQTGGSLVREVRPGGSGRPERQVYSAPPVEARFGGDSREARMSLALRGIRYGRLVRLDLECSAIPRSAP